MPCVFRWLPAGTPARALSRADRTWASPGRSRSAIGRSLRRRPSRSCWTRRRRCRRAPAMWRNSRGAFAAISANSGSWCSRGLLRSAARSSSLPRASPRATCPAGCTWSSLPRQPRLLSWRCKLTVACPCRRSDEGVGGSRRSTCCEERSSPLPWLVWSGPRRCRGHDGDRSRRHSAGPRADGLACSSRQARIRCWCDRQGARAVADRLSPPR